MKEIAVRDLLADEMHDKKELGRQERQAGRQTEEWTEREGRGTDRRRRARVLSRCAAL